MARSGTFPGNVVATPSRPAHLLLVDDTPGDIRLVQEALAAIESAPALQFTVAHDGAEVLALLCREGTPRPDLILLDLNMPRRNGLEVLAAPKEDPTLRRIPVVVFSTSAAADVQAAYDRHAACYLTEPADLDRFIAVIGALTDFWFSVVTLPAW